MESEEAILSGSVGAEPQYSIETSGQEVREFDFSDPSFNSTWE